MKVDCWQETRCKQQLNVWLILLNHQPQHPLSEVLRCVKTTLRFVLCFCASAVIIYTTTRGHSSRKYKQVIDQSCNSFCEESLKIQSKLSIPWLIRYIYILVYYSFWPSFIIYVTITLCSSSLMWGNRLVRLLKPIWNRKVRQTVKLLPKWSITNQRSCYFPVRNGGLHCSHVTVLHIILLLWRQRK